MGSGVSTIAMMSSKQLLDTVLWSIGLEFKTETEFRSVQSALQSHEVTGAMLSSMAEDEMTSFFVSIGILPHFAPQMAKKLAERMSANTPEALCQFGVGQVAMEVERLGDQYHPYVKMIDDAKITGQVIHDSTAEQLHEVLKAVGLTNVPHRAVIVARLMAIKKAYCTTKPTADTSKTKLPEHATLAPRDCLSKLFQIQGIPLDPDDIDVAADRIVKAIGPSTASEDQGTYDCFINYRVASDKLTADRLYGRLVMRGLRPFLDKVCLVNGVDWKEGFLLGLEKSRHFVALISRQALSNFRDFKRDHSRDNVLLEYETALRHMKEKGDHYIIPVLVGEEQKGALVKFKDFEPDLYAPTIKP